jgi:hypothetical protein
VDIGAISDFYRRCPDGWHVDHILPLSRGGAHTLSNLQYLDSFDNLSKGSMTQEEFDLFRSRFGSGGWDKIKAAAVESEHPWTLPSFHHSSKQPTFEFSEDLTLADFTE